MHRNEDEEGRKETVYPMLYSWRNRRDIDGCRLPAILPMYVPMLLFFGIHFVMLLVGKTRYPRRMLVFHPVTWNLLLVAVPDIAQAMQVPTATWMSVMSRSSTNTAIVIWCIAAAVYERNHT